VIRRHEGEAAAPRERAALLGKGKDPVGAVGRCPARAVEPLRRYGAAERWQSRIDRVKTFQHLYSSKRTHEPTLALFEMAAGWLDDAFNGGIGRTELLQAWDDPGMRPAFDMLRLLVDGLAERAGLVERASPADPLAEAVAQARREKERAAADDEDRRRWQRYDRLLGRGCELLNPEARFSKWLCGDDGQPMEGYADRLLAVGVLLRDNGLAEHLATVPDGCPLVRRLADRALRRAADDDAEGVSGAVALAEELGASTSFLAICRELYAAAVNRWQVPPAPPAPPPAAPAAGASNKPRRPCYDRDHLWLRWHEEEGMNPAAIRDRWNREYQQHGGERIAAKKRGLFVVIEGLKKAKEERGNN
jgi:hypothetical protein